MVHHQGNEQIGGVVSSTLITALEHSINELQHYPEQTDRSLTVMIPRAKYHPTVLPSTQLLHHQLTMERSKPHDQNKTTINMGISSNSGMDDMHAHHSDAEHMQLSSNFMSSVDPKVLYLQLILSFIELTVIAINGRCSCKFTDQCSQCFFQTNYDKRMTWFRRRHILGFNMGCDRSSDQINFSYFVEF